MTRPIHFAAKYAHTSAARFLCLAAFALTPLAGCGLAPKDVWVYIDNAGIVPLEITVDGELADTIEPDEFAKLVLPPGEHQFLVKAGNEVLCDLKRDLALSDRFGQVRKYLFNPDKLTRYESYDAEYGVNRLAGVMQAGFLAYQKNPQIKRQYIYRQLLKEINLVPGDAWNDVTGIDYVLTSPPDHIFTKGTARRSVLSRVQPHLADRLERMAKIETPSEEDIDALDELIEEMLADAL